MIYILCPSYQDAQDAFDCFVDYIEHNAPWELSWVHPAGNLVVTDDDLKYVFIYHRYYPIVHKKEDEAIDMDDFFNDIIDQYYYGG